MRAKWIGRISMVAIFVLIVIAGFGQAVLQLWNLLMPDIFGLHPISFWQAVGLMALSWLLFGGLGHVPRPAAVRHALAAPHGGAFGTDASRRAGAVSYKACGGAAEVTKRPQQAPRLEAVAGSDVRR